MPIFLLIVTVITLAYSFPNSITTTCCRLVADLLASLHVNIHVVCCVANKCVTRWQLSRLRGSYGETIETIECVIDFGH